MTRQGLKSILIAIEMIEVDRELVGGDKDTPTPPDYNYDSIS